MKVVKAHEVKHDLMRYAFFERGHIAVVTEGLRGADVLSITKANYAVEFEVKTSRSDLKRELDAIEYALRTNAGESIAHNPGTEQATLNLGMDKLKRSAGGWSKISKHEEYTDPKAYFERHKRYMLTHSYIPNYFYLVVPQSLVEYTLSRIGSTKYGVIAFDGCRQAGQHYAYFHNGVWYERGGEPEGAKWMRGAACEFTADGCYQEIAVKQKARLIHSGKVDQDITNSILARAVTENIRMLKELVVMGNLLKDNNIPMPEAVSYV